MNSTIDTRAAIDRLMRFLSVEGITGKEKNIAREVQTALREAGVSSKRIRFDQANERIPLPTQTGNLIADLPGTVSGPRLLFMTHLDTVPLCAGAEPVRKGNKITPKGRTALGGDNRTGCAVLVTLAATLLEKQLPHPPITFLFTVREESGLFGARYVDPADLMAPAMGFNVDGRSASEITIGAVGADRWVVDIHGKAAHAGVHPERGISASMIASLALATVCEKGWFGKIEKENKTGTSNVGSIGDAAGKSAGEATNVVTDFVRIYGESRSHDAKFVREITAAYKDAFKSAISRVTDYEGKTGKCTFTSRLDYHPFKLDESALVVQQAAAAVKSIGREPTCRTTNGGLDANWLVKHGIPTITFGAGQNEIHTVKEWVDLNEFEAGCRVALALATMGGQPMRDFADKAIRDALLKPENLRDLLRSQAPELVNGFDFARVRNIPSQFLLPDGRGREADLLFEIPYRLGNEEKITLVCVLIEHQTGADPRMAFRTLLYVVLYWERHWSAWEDLPTPRPDFRLPPVLPIVFHTGTRPWGSARSIAELLGEPKEFHPFAPIWEPLFWELPKQSSDELLSANEAFLNALAVIRMEDADRPEFERVYGDALKRIFSEQATDRVRWADLIYLIIGWITHRRPSSERLQLIQIAEKMAVNAAQREEVTNMIESYADVLLAEGERKGEHKGKLEGEREGRLKEARKILVRLGSKNWGPPDAAADSILQSIADVDHLERMTDRLNEAASWADLLTTK